MRKFILITFILLGAASANAQDSSLTRVIDADTVNILGAIAANTFLFIDSIGHTPLETVLRSKFVPLKTSSEHLYISDRLVTSTFYLKFTLLNSSAKEKKYYYFPGMLCQSIYSHRIEDNVITSSGNLAKINGGFIPIKIAPHQQVTYLFELHFFKTGLNYLESKLITPNHLPLFKNEMFQSPSDKKTWGLLLSGMLFMMILVTLLNFIVTKKIEFLYNSLYSFCMFLLIFLTTYLIMNPGWLKGFFFSYLDLLLLMVGTICYLEFTRKFLNTRENHKKLNRFLLIESWVIALLAVVFTIIHFGFDFYIFEIYFEHAVKILMLLAGFVFIFLSFTERNPLMNYLAIGVTAQLFFFIISLACILAGADTSSVLTSPIFYFELGVISAIIFFLLGLFYKNRQELIIKIQEQEAMKLAVEKQSFENQLSIYVAQQEERNRISADMHDDLGAGMTAIRLYSELAKQKSAGNILPEIEKISSFADDLINKMNAIIWSMSSQHDKLENMVAYIRVYTTEYLEGMGIKPIIDLPEKLPAIEVSGIIRRNIFLVIKEALQNVVKHANATEVKIVMLKHPEGFSLTIHDNGKGIELDNVRQFSNGLKNMRKRMQTVNIEFSIEKNNGTLIRLYGKTR